MPEAVSRKVFGPARHTGWNDLGDPSLAQAFGRTWLQERRSALLVVPSVVTGGRDSNVLVNPDHPDVTRIAVGPETPLAFDRRLFS